jgi:phage terminase large subunit-like protein
MKIDVREALVPNVLLMMENPDDEQEKVKDVVGSSFIWNQKFLKSKT